MIELRDRLIRCFRLVFPKLAEGRIPDANVTTVADWDSVAAITLIQVIEEEFQIEVDLEEIGELDSFDSIAAHLAAKIA